MFLFLYIVCRKTLYKCVGVCSYRLASATSHIYAKLLIRIKDWGIRVGIKFTDLGQDQR